METEQIDDLMVENIELQSRYLKRTVRIDLYHTYAESEYCNLLLVNDGQDLITMDFISMLKKLKLKPLIIAGIHCSDDRKNEYGMSAGTDYKGWGAKAGLYEKFIVKELIPFLQNHFSTITFNGTSFAGFSLGALSAFDIAWNNDNCFDAVGVFSGSFWWRKKDLKAGYTDKDRILHEMIGETKTNPALKFWLMTGTNDEMADRNHNFIIDSIDDTIDVVKELMHKGYKRPHDIFYYEMVGGKHDVPTWAKAMPAFLIWAFAK